MLRRLPTAQRAAMTLRYLDDLPVREVAALLDRSEGSVESLLSRGREALRRATGDHRMNDEQLIHALRGLDQPVLPDPSFAESLLVDLRRQVQPKREGRLQLLLVAALLATAAFAAALAIGGGSFRPDHALSDATTPAPSSSPTVVPSAPDLSAPPS